MNIFLYLIECEIIGVIKWQFLLSMLKFSKVRRSQSGHNSYRPVGMTRANDCGTDAPESRVVLLVGRDRDVVLVAAGQDVERGVASLLELLCTHEGTNA